MQQQFIIKSIIYTHMEIISASIIEFSEYNAQKYILFFIWKNALV